MNKIAAVLFLLCTVAACDKVPKDIPNPLGEKKDTGGDTAGAMAALNAYKDAVAKQDWQKMYGMMSAEFQKGAVADIERLKAGLNSKDPAEKKTAEDRLTALGLDPEEFRTGDAAQLAVKFLGAEVAKKSGRVPGEVASVQAITLDGDRATVKFTDGSGRAGTLRFMKQNGAWRMAP